MKNENKPDYFETQLFDFQDALEIQTLEDDLFDDELFDEPDTEIKIKQKKDSTYDTDDAIEKYILIGIDDGKSLLSISDSLDELAELVETAGATVVGRMSQKLDIRNNAHYFGKGKIDELKELVTLNKATAVVCDDELSSSQMRNLTDMLEVKVIDRTLLILDIFAGRALFTEGKLQVELARLKYNLSHLAGLGKSLSRLGGGAGGGIGARRGSGEKKLELDRRYIRDRIADLNREIKTLQAQRKLTRDKRTRTGIPVVSLVGYTNAGKSSIMNTLTNAGVLAENKLFATLDTTTRRLRLSGGSEILFTDTVGFIQKLPHNLVDAFRATLEELRFADVLVHVVDASSQNREEQMTVVYETLKTLECSEKLIITAFNKMDLEVELPLPLDRKATATLQTSAKTGVGKEQVVQEIETVLKSLRKKMKVLIPYSDSALVGLLHGKCEIIVEEFKEDGTYFEFYANEELQNRFAKFEQI